MKNRALACWIRRLLLVAAALFVASQALAQAYPDRVVRILNPFPGAPVDATLRILAEKLSQKWGQPVIIDPRPGGSELIVGDAGAKAAPDGYTLIAAADSTFLHNMFIFAKMPFDPLRDLVPVTQFWDVRFGLFVRGDLKANNLKEFVALMKESPNKYTYASAGVGTNLQLSMEQFMLDANFSMLHVPYKSAPEIVQGVLSGSTDAFIASVQVGAPQLASGRLKMLAIGGEPERLKILPDVPTFAEQGYPNSGMGGMLGLAVPKGTPDAIVNKLYEDFREVITSSDFRTRALDLQGYTPIASSPAQFAEYLRKTRQERGALIKKLGIQLN